MVLQLVEVILSPDLLKGKGNGKGRRRKSKNVEFEKEEM